MKTAGDCTKCFGTVLHGGSFADFVTVHHANSDRGRAGDVAAASRTAPAGAQAEAPPGGIDFNINTVTLKTRGGEIKFNIPYDLEGIQPDLVDGINAVIINIRPFEHTHLLISETKGEMGGMPK